MAEQKAEIDNSAPFASVKAAVSMFGDRIPIKSSGGPAHASHSHHHHPPTFSANNHGYVGHQAPHLFPQNAEKIATLEGELQLAHEELLKLKTALAVAENAKAEALKELAETRSLLDDKPQLEHGAMADDATTAATEAAPHNLSQTWGDTLDWQTQLDAVLANGSLGNMGTGNVAPEVQEDSHLGMQTEPDAAQRDEAMAFQTQQHDAELERAHKEILGLQAEHAAFASEIGNAQKQIVELRAQLTSSSAQHGSLTTDLETARAEVARLQVELASLSEQHGSSAAGLDSAKQEISRLEAELVQQGSTLVDLENARKEVTVLQTQLKEASEQHGASVAELASAREEISSLQAELTTVQNDMGGLLGQLNDALGQHGSSIAELASVKEQISSLQAELQTISEQNSSYAVDLENAKQEINRLQDELRGEQQSDELLKELIATNETLEKMSAARAMAETELVILREAALNHSAAEAELEQVRTELNVLKEAEAKLAESIAQLEATKAELAFCKDEEASLGVTIASKTAELEELNAELRLIKEAEEKYRGVVAVTALDLEEARSKLLAAKEAEETATGALAATTAEFETLKAEFSAAKETQEKSGEAMILTNKELEELKAELAATKDSEQRFKAAVADYSLKLQGLKLDLEDTTKIAEKARSFAMQLEESNVKLKKAIEQEQTMSASLASLKAELNNTRTELAAVKEEGEAAVADVSAEMQLELSRANNLLEAATTAEAKAKESVARLNDALNQVTLEVDEAKAVAKKAAEEAETSKHKLEEAQAHTDTLQSQLQAVIMELEAVKASEAHALSQVKVRRENNMDIDAEGNEQGPEITLPREEYEALTRQVQEADELANKRVVAALAKVDAAKASELELQRKLDGAQNEAEVMRVALKQATQKVENAEAAKSAIEEMLRRGRGERRTHAHHPGGADGGYIASPLHVLGDGRAYMNSPTPITSQNSSPLHPLFGDAHHVAATLPVPEERTSESLADILQSKVTPEEKAKKGRFSTKLGSYFNKKAK
ncbi:unnamed protein product [Sphagnum compactum]